MGECVSERKVDWQCCAVLLLHFATDEEERREEVAKE